MKLIVGLGNPGEKYAKVRHNLGFMVVDELAKRIKQKELSFRNESKFKSEIMQTSLILNSYSLPLLLVKPQTYMNNSGMAVKLLSTVYSLQSTDIIIVHDDLDLMLGKIKIRIGGAAAGHHGVESIISALGTDEFIRVRLGIGNLRSMSGEHKGQAFNAEHFVLESFMPQEKSKVKHMLKQAMKALELLLEKGLPAGKAGLTVAQNQYN